MKAFYKLSSTKSKGNNYSLVDRLYLGLLDGLIYLLDTKKNILSIKLKETDVKRGQTFVNDLISSYGEDCPSSFSIADLISVLYDDFICQVQNGNQSHEMIARFLLKGRSYFLNGVKNPELQTKRVVSQVSANTFLLEDSVTSDKILNPKESFVYVDIEINKSAVERGNTLLSDLELYFNGEEFSIEEVMAIRFLDFIESLRIEGNNQKVMRAILKQLE